jgi:hypothetical protein
MNSKHRVDRTMGHPRPPRSELRVGADLGAPRRSKARAMTLIWFIVWLVANKVGDQEPLLANPVNWWAGTLIGAVALDLASHHARAGHR